MTRKNGQAIKLACLMGYKLRTMQERLMNLRLQGRLPAKLQKLDEPVGESTGE